MCQLTKTIKTIKEDKILCICMHSTSRDIFLDTYILWIYSSCLRRCLIISRSKIDNTNMSNHFLWYIVFWFIQRWRVYVSSAVTWLTSKTWWQDSTFSISYMWCSSSSTMDQIYNSRAPKHMFCSWNLLRKAEQIRLWCGPVQRLRHQAAVVTK